MKLRLLLKTKTNKGKDVEIKFNIAPSKHYGFINFINLVLKQNLPVTLTFEKVSKSGQKELSKVQGQFLFESKDEQEIKNLSQEIESDERKRKKQHQKRTHK
ncbi:MAG: hypothetical protein ACFFKA_08750 [Candidatus Thorarchaeota archaeon]